MKKLAKIFMMATLVLGVASCNDKDDAPTLPNNPADNQEEVEEPTGGQINIVQKMKEEASMYDNITIVDKTTDNLDVIYGCGIMCFDYSSFERYATMVIFDDYQVIYEINIPSEGAKLNLKVDYDHYIGFSEIMYLNKERIKIPFEKELLGLRSDSELYKNNQEIGEIEYYHKTYNDYLVGVYDSPQLLQLEILSNQSGEEQILSFRVSDYLPFASATVNIIQAAK